MFYISFPKSYLYKLQSDSSTSWQSHHTWTTYA